MRARQVRAGDLNGSWFEGEHPPIVFVHGTMDRSAGLRRTIRAVQPVGVLAYDRRGYATSLAAASPATSMEEQVSDLMGMVDAVTTGSVVVVGHSLGALIALHAAVRHPDRVLSVGAWEPPMPWFDWYREDAEGAGIVGGDEDPADAAERFMRAMIGNRLWERLPGSFREERRSEGVTLRADLALVAQPASVIDLGAVAVPVVAGCGTESSERFRRSARTVATEVPGATLHEIPGATHGAHLTHSAEFARFALAARARAPLAA